MIVMLSDLCEQGEVNNITHIQCGLITVERLRTILCCFQEVCYQYWPGQRAQSYGEFKVELINEDKYNGYVLRTFSLQQAKVR